MSSNNNISSDDIHIHMNAYLRALTNTIASKTNTETASIILKNLTMIRETFNSKENLDIINSKLIPELLLLVNQMLCNSTKSDTIKWIKATVKEMSNTVNIYILKYNNTDIILKYKIQIKQLEDENRQLKEQLRR